MVPTEATQKAVWLMTFMREIGKKAVDDTLTIFEDKQDAILLAKNRGLASGPRILIYATTLCVRTSKNQFVLQYYPTQDTLAGIMKKSIATPQVTISGTN